MTRFGAGGGCGLRAIQVSVCGRYNGRFVHAVNSRIGYSVPLWSGFGRVPY